MAKKNYDVGSRPKARGTGWYTNEGMAKDPIRENSADAGNSTTKPRQLNYDKLLNQGLSSKLPKKA
jgi:hypothetical protein